MIIGAFLATAALLLAAPTSRPGVVRIGLVEADLAAREVRVPAEVVVVDVPLEFVLVVAGTADHETVLRTTARPSDLHAALLALGLEPGSPARWDEDAQRWLAPSGAAVDFSVIPEGGPEVPVESWVRAINGGGPMPPRTWVFAGSYVGDDGAYAADLTGLIAGLANFESNTLDLPELASASSPALLWEIDPEAAPPSGTPATLVIRPLAGADNAGAAGPGLSGVPHGTPQ